MKKYFIGLGSLLLVIWLWIRYSQWYITIDIPFLNTEQEVVITPISGDLYIPPYWVEENIIEILGESKYVLWMREYSITMREVITLLKNKSNLWTDVKIILENKTYWDNTKNWTEFKQKIVWAPIKIKSDEHLGTNFVHAKTIVTDDTVVFSTANLWYQWFWKNREYWFATKNEEVVENMKRLYEQDRDGKTIHPVDIHPAVWFCPVNCRRKLNTLIASATQSIYIEAQYIEDDLLIQQLIKKQEAWIVLNIIVGEHQERDLLEGLSWVRIQHSPYLHAKNILIDSKELLITSMNLSTNAIENNREIGIVTQDKKAIGSFIYQFDKDWLWAEEI